MGHFRVAHCFSADQKTHFHHKKRATGFIETFENRGYLDGVRSVRPYFGTHKNGIYFRGFPDSFSRVNNSNAGQI